MNTTRKTIGVTVGAALLAFAASPAFADEPTTTSPAPTRVSLQLHQDPDSTTYLVPATGVQDDTYTTMNTPLLASGIVVFGASYGASVIAASQSDNDADDRLWVPIAGPWLDLSDRGDCNIQNDACDNETTTKVLLVADGVFQAGGAAMILGSMLFPRTVHRTAPVAALEHVKPIRVGQDGHGFAYAAKF
jgi:hypothetical protein